MQFGSSQHLQALMERHIHLYHNYIQLQAPKPYTPQSHIICRCTCWNLHKDIQQALNSQQKPLPPRKRTVEITGSKRTAWSYNYSKVNASIIVSRRNTVCREQGAKEWWMRLNHDISGVSTLSIQWNHDAEYFKIHVTGKIIDLTNGSFGIDWVERGWGRLISGVGSVILQILRINHHSSHDNVGSGWVGFRWDSGWLVMGLWSGPFDQDSLTHLGKTEIRVETTVNKSRQFSIQLLLQKKNKNNKNHLLNAKLTQKLLMAVGPLA